MILGESLLPPPTAHATIVPTIIVLETPPNTAPRLILYAMEYDCS